MKPIIIYVDDKCENITMTRERFEKLINEAYENGKHDASSVVQYVPYNSFPSITPSITYGTDSNKPIDLTPTITCESPKVYYSTTGIASK